MHLYHIRVTLLMVPGEDQKHAGIMAALLRAIPMCRSHKSPPSSLHGPLRSQEALQHSWQMRARMLQVNPSGQLPQVPLMISGMIQSRPFKDLQNCMKLDPLSFVIAAMDLLIHTAARCQTFAQLQSSSIFCTFPSTRLTRSWKPHALHASCHSLTSANQSSTWLSKVHVCLVVRVAQLHTYHCLSQRRHWFHALEPASVSAMLSR